MKKNNDIQKLFPVRFFLKEEKNLNYFCTGCPKSAMRRVLTIFLEREKIHRGIRNQKLGKVKKFQVWVVRRFFEQRAKNCRGDGFHHPPLGPYRVK